MGPWLNQPEEYEGYNGFVGWAGVSRFGDGRWALTFTSGYWHGSPPWTEEIEENEACRNKFENFHKMYGFTKVCAPRGGRVHVMYSEDRGGTWSRPETFIDTQLDDRHAAIIELDDGSLLCTFFVYGLPDVIKAMYMYSCDRGKTWEGPLELEGGSGGFGNKAAVQLSDGTVLWPIAGRLDPDTEHSIIGVYSSKDRGKTFEPASRVYGPDSQHEPSIAELPDGRIVMMTRPHGDVFWSKDGGRSWSKPVRVGVEVRDPHLVLANNGVLACFHRSSGGLRVIVSSDMGKSWHGSGDRIGYCIDPDVYGYSCPMVLDDGSIYLVYQHSGGHTATDARTGGIWGLRVRIKDSAEGIEILSASD